MDTMKVYFLSKVDGSKSAINEGPLQEKANQLLPNQKLAASAERQIRIAKLHQEIKAGRMGLLISSSAVMDVCFYSYKQFNYGYNSNCLTCILMMVQDPFNEFPD